MRGKDMGIDYRKLFSRITPAYAGKSSPFFVICSPSQDHPRVCGEKALAFAGRAHAEGSPPRMRGKVTWLQNLEEIVRITPAYAGKRYAARLSVHRHEDHPRVCGEKLQNCRMFSAVMGSPPRMRGKDFVPTEWVVNDRITPAYAGKRSPFLCSGLNHKDHPRICGEKLRKHSYETSGRGSPPHMRGKVVLNEWNMSAEGITPAYAGKSRNLKLVFGIV